MALYENIHKPDNKNNYSISEIPSQIYLFEIIIKNNKNQTTILRKIKNQKISKIISINDNIIYDDINKLKISVIDFNNPLNKINLKIKFKKKLTSAFIKNKKINISICKITQGLTECNYQLLF
jgi:hypothetical protein